MIELKTMEYLKILLDRDNIKLSDIAKKLDTTPQNIAQTFKRDNITIERLKEIAAAAGYELVIDFKKVE